MSHHANTMTAVATTDTSVQLRRWLQHEKIEKPMTVFADPQQSKNNINNERQKKESIIRRTTIAYGIAELLLKHPNVMPGYVHINNFVVSVSVCNKKRSSRRQTWDDIEGVGMKSSGLSLTIEEPSYLRGLLEGEDCDGQMGRCLEVFESVSSSAPQEKSKTPTAAATVHRSEQENNRCHLFARLLYELFTGEPFPDDALADSAVASTKEPDQKRSKSNHVSSRKKLMLSRAKGDFDRAELPFQISSIVRMQELGIPASICLMTQNLLECPLRGDGGQPDNAYVSLGVVVEDLHLLLLDPDRFLFDNEHQNKQLLFREEKLYGRDKEETLITDAFCRVSRGKSEAFFIGGFSGSGKSMLVNSLRERVNCVGGYVIKHKFDAMSQEKPLSGVISAVNQICPMIRKGARPVIAKKLRDEFGVDFSLLMRLLPSVSVLFPEFVSPVIGEQPDGDTVNVRGVCHTLLRFVRVISSPRHPVMVSRIFIITLSLSTM